MKIWKRLTVALLCLSILLSMAFFVRAVNMPADQGLKLMNAFAMSNRLVRSWTNGTGGNDNQTDHCVLLYFNDNVNDAYHIRNNNYVKLYIEPYQANGASLGLQDAGFQAVDYYAVTDTGKKAVVLRFGTQNGSTFTPNANGFSYWREQGAIGFRLYIVDNKGAGINDKVDGWATSISYGWPLVANGVHEGRDAVIQEILFEEDCLAVTRWFPVSDSKILIHFSDPIDMSPLAANNGPIQMELHATPGTILDANRRPWDGKSAWTESMAAVNKSWPAKSATILDNPQWVEVDFGGTSVSDAFAYAKEAGNGLFLHFSENTSATNPKFGASGEQADNGLIDGIWSMQTNSPLLAITGKHRTDIAGDTTYVASTSAAKIGNTNYLSLAQALAAAKDGETVTLLQDTTTADRFVVIPPEVTLNLNGHTVVADNMVSFGSVTDSSEGNGGLIITQDKTKAVVSLQPNNASFPLYDAALGGYRFFSYQVLNAGTRFDADDPTWIKYGIQVLFPSLRAYELLASSENADVALLLDITVGKTNIPYQFNQSVLRTLYQTIKTNGLANANRYALTLKISGLSDEVTLQAKPVLYSKRDVSASGLPIAYEGENDPYTAAKNWVNEQIENDTLFSFDYNGVAYADHIKNWTKTVEKGFDCWTVTYTNGDVTAWSEIAFDPEMAGVEWTNYFKNNGSANSPTISNIMAADTSVTVSSPTLTTANGSTASATDFEPITVDLTAKTTYHMQTTGGRSSQGAFPYFDISNGEYGVIGAIGWTGNWKAEFTNTDGKIGFVAGMQSTNISLYAGEQMRTPMIMLQFFKGDQTDGHNDLRQLMLKSYMPQENGKPIVLPQFTSTNNPGNESALIRLMESKIASRNTDGLWIDACWYGELTIDNTISDNTWSKQVGNWYFDDERYPNNNMLAFGEWMEQQNKEFLLWLEPERVYYGTELYNNHKDWLIDSGSVLVSPRTYLFDFSNDEACDYMIDRISGILSGSKVTWYRQDFNMDPARYWSNKDTANRVGMTEIQYITNLYRYLDTLVARNPGLMIDNCASGGRRLDLEMMKRSVPLWRSDFSTAMVGQADAIRSINYNLTWWIPAHGGRSPVEYLNELSNADHSTEQLNRYQMYSMRAFMSAGGGFGALNGLSETTVAYAFAQNNVCKTMMYGDYYRLSHGIGDAVMTQNAAYQFNLPQAGKGYVISFCPISGTEGSSTYLLRGLEASGLYRMENADTGETFTATGAQLMKQGLTCTYADVMSSSLIYYTQIG